MGEFGDGITLPNSLSNTCCMCRISGRATSSRVKRKRCCHEGVTNIGSNESFFVIGRGWWREGGYSSARLYLRSQQKRIVYAHG